MLLVIRRSRYDPHGRPTPPLPEVRSRVNPSRREAIRDVNHPPRRIRRLREERSDQTDRGNEGRSITIEELPVIGEEDGK